MRIPRIYCPQALQLNTTVQLEEAASHHVLKVLRMSVGRELILFNGMENDHGQLGDYSAQIVETTKKHATLNIEGFTPSDTESPLHTHLAIGLSRGERFELALQKATELGASEITPLFTERTEVKLQGDRLEKKHVSWEKIIISACEQSGRTRLPKLNTATRFSDFVGQNHAGKKLVLHHRSPIELKPNSDNAESNIRHLTFLIGPEGGLSEMEIENANNRGFENIKLGPRVLRTETAPLAALTLFQYLWGDI